MALADPQSITINSVTSSLPRVSTGQNESSYLDSSGLIRLSLSSQYANSGRKRRVLRLDHSKITADPFVPANNTQVSMSNYMVFDVPPAGYTNAEIKQVYDGFKTLYTATSDLVITKLLGGES